MRSISPEMMIYCSISLPSHRHITLNLAGADVYDLDLVCDGRLLLEVDLLSKPCLWIKCAAREAMFRE
ncbi:MAG: hypothetical protein J6X16_01345 [Bacteroidales bacterium]|nr:hypothetical protein [Bacteroidales bacterium]